MPEYVYPLDYGYLEGTNGGDGSGIDAWIYRGDEAGHGLMLVTSHGELVNYYPSGMATAEVDALARTEGEALVVYAGDPVGALHVLTEALFAGWDGFTGEERWLVAELAEHAAGPSANGYFMQRDISRGWVPTRVLDELGKRDWDEARRLIDDHQAERGRVVGMFADRPDRAGPVAHYLDQHHLATLARAPQPTVTKDALEPVIKRADEELDTIVRGVRLSRKDHRKAHRDLKRGLDYYWGKRALNKHVSVPHHVRGVAHRLAVAAYLAGQPLPVPELIELATRLLYWSTATAPYSGKHDEDHGHQPGVDIGAPVRDAVTAAFARLLPEPLRDALGLDRHLLQRSGITWTGSTGGSSTSSSICPTRTRRADR